MKHAGDFALRFSLFLVSKLPRTKAFGRSDKAISKYDRIQAGNLCIKMDDEVKLDNFSLGRNYELLHASES